MIERKAKWCAHVMRQGGIPSAVIDGQPTGTIRGRGRPKLHWIDNGTQWGSRSVGELRRAQIERERVMAETPGLCPPLQFEDGVATDASLCRMMSEVNE